jgi:hypothetical protein
MKATLLLTLILSGIQANYINNNTNSTSALGNGTRIYNISTALPEVSTNLPVTRIPPPCKNTYFFNRSI